MKLTVVGGCGYVGLITGLGFAELGHDVVAVDADKSKVGPCSKGRPLIFEEGLEEALRRSLDSGRIRFTADLGAGSRDAEVIFVAVGSPARPDGTADLSQIETVALELARVRGHAAIVAIKSTVPVGAVESIRRAFCGDGFEEEDLDLVVNPEFLREGRGLHDFFHPTRIIIGGGSDRARAVMRRLYAPFTQSREAGTGPRDMAEEVPLIETTIAEAQMIKYAANAFLATRISFINEIATVCERVGADVARVIEGLGHDPRIGSSYLQPGIGFGGPCLEKDLRALIESSRRHEYSPPLLEAVVDRNERQVRGVVGKAKRLVGSELPGTCIAVFGLAFKSGTNDVRNSLSMRVVRSLVDEGATVRAHDPVGIPEAHALLPEAAYEPDPYRAVRNATALLILTGWPEYRDLDYELIGGEMRSRNLLDGCNLLDPVEMRRLGFNYVGVGR